MKDREYSTVWIDFVTYPYYGERVTNMEERRDTSKAYFPNEDGRFPEEYSPASPEGAVITKDHIETFGKFEAMFFDHFGNVTIWTTKGMWHTRNQGKVERFLFYPFDHTELSE